MSLFSFTKLSLLWRYQIVITKLSLFCCYQIVITKLSLLWAYQIVITKLSLPNCHLTKLSLPNWHYQKSAHRWTNFTADSNLASPIQIPLHLYFESVIKDLNQRKVVQRPLANSFNSVPELKCGFTSVWVEIPSTKKCNQAFIKRFFFAVVVCWMVRHQSFSQYYY